MYYVYRVWKKESGTCVVQIKYVVDVGAMCDI